MQRLIDYWKSSHALPNGDLRGRRATPAAIPDINGPGAVLNVGSVVMKVTNFGTIGNPFVNLSTDPSAQWPGASGVEYLGFTTGTFDLVLLVRAPDMETLRDVVLERLQSMPEIRSTQTSFVLEELRGSP